MQAGNHEQKSVVLILARELATNVATPMLILDRRGVLVFYNEPAEQILGETFADTGEVSPDDWADRWYTEDLNGQKVSVLDLPLAKVFTERVPVHSALRVLGRDGVFRKVAATAYPLYARADQFVGAMAVFWEDDGRV